MKCVEYLKHFNMSNAEKNNKRTASASSNLSDQHSKMDSKRVNITPLIKEDELPDSMPKWASIFFEKLNTLNESVQYIGQSVDSALEQHDKLEKRISHLETDTTSIKYDSVKLRSQLEELQDKQLEMECDMRKSNMILSGIGDAKQEDIRQKVDETLKHIKEESGEPLPIKSCFRLGRFVPGANREVLISFVHDSSKHRVFANKKKLPEKVFAKDDLPAEVRQRRKDLMPIFRLAKSKETYNKITKFKGDKLIIGRSKYGVYPRNNLHQLPPDLSPANSCKKEDDTAFVFFGKHNPLSNFYPCSINIEGVKYTSSEQYIQEQKSIFFNNFEVAERIRNSATPLDAKTLSYDISNYNHSAWVSVAGNFLTIALKNKFAQNEHCRSYLCDTQSKLLGEATKDMTWGTGISLDNPTSTDSANWTGANLMGKTLMTVRSDFM